MLEKLVRELRRFSTLSKKHVFLNYWDEITLRVVCTSNACMAHASTQSLYSVSPPHMSAVAVCHGLGLPSHRESFLIFNFPK